MEYKLSKEGVDYLLHILNAEQKKMHYAESLHDWDIVVYSQEWYDKYKYLPLVNELISRLTL